MLLFLQRFVLVLLCVNSLSQASLAVASPIIASPQLLFDKGMVLSQQQKHSTAQKYWEAYLNNTGKQCNKTEAAYYRIVSALENQEPDAELLVQRFILHYPHSQHVDSLRYRLAKFFFKQGSLSKCLLLYHTIHIKRLSPAEQESYPYELGNVYLTAKDWSKAKKKFTEIKNKTHPYYYPAQLRMAYIALKQEKYDQAIATLEAISKHINDLPEAISLTLEIYHKSRNFEKLLAYIPHLPATAFTKQEQLLIGDAYFFLKQYQAAVSHYQAYLRDGVYDPTTAAKLGYAFYAMQQYTQALTYFKPLLNQSDHNAQIAAYYSGLIYETTHATQAAIEAFEKAAKQKFNIELADLASIKCAGLYYQQGDLQAVIQAMGTFTQENKTSKHLISAQIMLIKSYYQTKSYTEALDYIATLPYKNETILKLYQKLLFYRGLEAYNQGALDVALSYLKQSLHFPFKAALVTQAHFWIAEAFAGLGAYAKALKFYTQLMQQGSANALYHERTLYGLAYAYFNTGNYKAAMTTFKQYAALLPEQPAASMHYDALLRLGDCYYVDKNYKEAITLYERVYAYNPAHVRYQEALIHQIMGNTTAATQCLQEIITQHAPTNYYEKACYQEACMAFDAGHYEIAIQKFSALLQKEPTLALQPDLLIKRALAYENLQKKEEAVADYIAILEKFPTHAHTESALMALSQLSAAEGKARQADYLQKYKQLPNALSSRSDAHALDAIKKLFYGQAYHKVLQQLTVFYTSYPNSTLLPEAYFLMAESYYRLHKISQALHYYKKVIESNQHALHIKAGLRLASIMYQRKQFQEALGYYQKLQKMEPTAKAYEQTLMGIVKSSFVLKKQQATLAACWQLLNNPNVTSVETIQQAHLYLGKVFMQQSEYKSAKSHFMKANMPLHTVAAAEAQYLLAHTTFTLKAYQDSLNSLFALIEKYPHHINYIDQAFLLMADNYIRLNNFTQAKATLDSIINKSKNKKTIATAKKKRNKVSAALKAK
ncbi:tetratricopeptide repeat protein [Candidatus Cardinium hertigii]|uniref:Outer membrane protein assembly factor BamD n=1 Tax=Candidatus Cardinium hertigii TaxID=247481 RepID=A0A2Z3L8W3_9BACT|nr:tetratricopeptide repeat protein [Candidatus Cardinium hertigii]AWN81829.1 Outer membrane protein assembly factor BamD [Candidatus Cardinium hertigii]